MVVPGPAITPVFTFCDDSRVIWRHTKHLLDSLLRLFAPRTERFFLPSFAFSCGPGDLPYFLWLTAAFFVNQPLPTNRSLLCISQRDPLTITPTHPMFHCLLCLCVCFFPLLAFKV